MIHISEGSTLGKYLSLCWLSRPYNLFWASIQKALWIIKLHMSPEYGWSLAQILVSTCRSKFGASLTIVVYRFAGARVLSQLKRSVYLCCLDPSPGNNDRYVDDIVAVGNFIWKPESLKAAKPLLPSVLQRPRLSKQAKMLPNYAAALVFTWTT